MDCDEHSFSLIYLPFGSGTHYNNVRDGL